MRDSLVDKNGMYTMITRNMNSVQQLLRFTNGHTFSYFLFPHSFKTLYF